MRSKGKVFKAKGTDTWYYAVYDHEGKIVLMDNCNSFETILSDCLLSVWGVRRIEIAGHHLEYSYTEICRHRLDEVPYKKRNHALKKKLKKFNRK